jgi:hypothetical protein
MKTILIADYNFALIKCWASIPCSAKEFIDQFLTVNLKELMTAYEAASHPFLKESNPEEQSSSRFKGEP